MERKYNDQSMMLWNMYVDKVEKIKYTKTLVENGKFKAQTAGIRAMMYLYNTDDSVRNKVNEIIDDFIVYKANGKPSIN